MSKFRGKSRQAVAFLLCFVILFCSVNIQASAEETSTNEEFGIMTMSSASNEQIIFDYLTDKNDGLGLSVAAACGILTNIYLESGFDYSSGSSTGAYYGLCQWSGSRLSTLKGGQFDYSTLEGQLEFIKYELKNDYSGVYDYIDRVSENAIGAYEAAAYFCKYYEIPSNSDVVSVTRGNTAVTTFWPKYESSADLEEYTAFELTGATIPSSLTTGESFAVKGFVTSPSDISEVSVWVYDSNNKQVTGTTKSVSGVLYYSLCNLDASVTFSSLSAGTYRYVVTATNTDGKKTFVDESFTVSKSSSSSSSSVTGTGTVNCNALNVRSGAGTSKSIVTTISNGQSVTVTGSTTDSSGDLWYSVTFTKSGKSYSGYVCAQYITMSSSGSGSSSSSSVTGTGTVNCTTLNVRSGAGTNNSKITTISKGQTVTVTGSTKDSSGTVWYSVTFTKSGKNYSGYVSSEYITMNSSSSSSSSSSDTADADNTTGTGTVNCTTLNVRTGAGTGNSIITTISKGQTVTVTGSTKDSSGTTWYSVTFTKSGKSYSGYVSSEYITMSGSTDSSGTSDSGNTSSASGAGVVNCTNLNLRSGAGTNNSSLGKLSKGTVVSITGEAKDSSGDLWYKVNVNGKTGYVHSTYITKKTSGKVNCSRLNVRKGAGTNNSVIVTIPNGTSVTISDAVPDSSNVMWYHVSFTYSGTSYTGYVSSQYIS